jgi:glycosyltransferase involved in cell wall biosynthesis
MLLKNTGKKNVMIVAGDFPYPPNHGGRADVWGRIKSLAEIDNIDLYLLVVTKEEIESSDYGVVKSIVKDICILKRKTGLNALFSYKPYQVSSRKQLTNVRVWDLKWDLILAEGHYVANFIENPSINYRCAYLRKHNDEEVYFRELAKSVKGYKKIFYMMESFKFRYYQREQEKKFDKLLYISRSEYKEKMDGSGYWLPAYVDLSDMKFNPSDSSNVLFVGSLFMPNNVWGINWYLKNVHPILCKKNTEYRLIIAGNFKNTGNVTLAIDERVKIMRNPTKKELDSIYDTASVFVAPVFHGAGVKIKILEAISKGFVVVTTKCGAEGTGLVTGEHLIVTNKADEFAKEILKLLGGNKLRKDIVESAQNYLKKEYDQKRSLEKVVF